MCGIAGVVSRASLTGEELGAVEAATAAMVHRGPDGAGWFSEKDVPLSHVRLGMRRLSIIDLANGWQPLHNEDQSLALVANGEIYNFIELRQELQSHGHRFRSGSDCEVLLHLYEEHQLEFVHHLRGMFAFALWDQRRQRLVLGRDRLGEKPLYLYAEGERLWFASELKSLLATQRIPLELDLDALDSYLHFGWVPEPQTMVAGVRKLPPGHLLIVDIASWSIREHCYWRLEDAAAVQGDGVERVRAELDTIGRQIVRSDVPIGISLSGGFDSSLVAALAHRHSPETVQAFTVGYAGMPAQDERSAAQAFARDLDLKFHHFEVSLPEMLEAFPQVCHWRDDPIADLAGHNYYAVSREARAHGCPVLLQGHGIDELLWGYSWAVQAVRCSIRNAAGDRIGRLEALWRQMPRSWARPELARAAYQYAGSILGWRCLSPAGNSSGVVSYDLSDTYQKGAFAAAATYGERVRGHLPGAGAVRTQFLSSADSASRADIQLVALLCRGYLLQNGLAQGDRLSMANSVEQRLPLVDYRLVELLVGIQKAAPMYESTPKSLLHEAARGLVPDYVTQRPKLGFTPPSAAWLAGLRERFGGELRRGTLVQARIIAPHAAARLSQCTSRFSAAADLFLKYLVLEFWHRGMQAVARGASEGSRDRAWA
ncbi:MAG TPA: asparagine synthase (glutamine-hydrolyzing) [Steroidobacteraceae bacterium]|nr:asparagine synthase (glutamine-hydrolyzing) [Steroidobacteraceae bacterium]